MADAAVYVQRRQGLAEALGGEPVLLVGHHVLPRNYAANFMPFRQDSTFLYYTGCQRPNAATVIEAGGRTTLYLPQPADDDALWHGEVDPPAAEGERCGADAVAPLERLAGDLERLRAGGALHTVPVVEPGAVALHTRLMAPDGVAAHSERAVEAVIRQRLTLDDTEVREMRAAAEVTARAFSLAMAATAPGETEDAIQALIEAVFRAARMTPAYPPIVTVHGEVLHGHAEGTVMAAEQLLLIDAGAESLRGYATDVTRTWPVGGRFDGRQRAVYDAVLAAQEAAIAQCRPGTRYRDVHLTACRKLAEFGVEAGLLRGSVDGLVEQGAHAVFFPHGVGHLIGLDVHDMELFGDTAGYAPGRERSSQFGLAYLRLDRDLEAGTAVTIEPGFYVVPAILRDADLRARLGDAVNWEAAESWVPFGGIRIEDDVLITDAGPEVLTAAIPKRADAVEAAVGTHTAASALLTA